MKILVAFPDNPYFNWQVLVQINNLVKFGFAYKIIYVVGKQPKKSLSNQIKTILHSAPVEYYTYNDTRVNSHYPSSLRPHILTKFFDENPQMSGETFFYIDPDTIFSKQLDFTTFLSGDTWYLSDTKSYIDSKYIKSKSEELFDTMSKIVKLNKNDIENNDINAGGAQYLMKNMNKEYWNKVYNDSEQLYGFMKRTEGYYSPQHPIQSWTSDMWAVLWNAWYFNHETRIVPELNFSWATDPISKWDTCNIFHNAGAINQTNLFKKTDYQTNPFNKDFSHVSDQYCSYKYMLEVEETKNNYQNLVQLF